MIDFHKRLSDRSVYLRYFGMLSLEERILHERLRRVCFIDYDREIALVADLKRHDGTHAILGVGRLKKEYGTNEAEFSVLISDDWQGRGLGSELLRSLVEIARREKVRRVTGRIMSQNKAMKRVSEEVGFKLRDEGGDEFLAEITL
jgi:acetyltransferase